MSAYNQKMEKMPMDAAFAPRSRRTISRRLARLSVLWSPAVLLAVITVASAAEPQPAQVGSGCVEVSCAGQPVKNRSWTAGGFTLLANADGPQVAVMQPPGVIAVCARGRRR